jgi:hypothetical protein
MGCCGDGRKALREKSKPRAAAGVPGNGPSPMRLVAGDERRPEKPQPILVRLIQR